MTSTNFCTGSFSDKPSSRVLKPPGGGSSDIFGASAEPNVNPSKVAHHQSAEERDILNQGKKPTNSVNSAVANPTSTPALDNAAIRNKHRGTFNPITGEDYELKSDAKEKNNDAGKAGYSTRPW